MSKIFVTGAAGFIGSAVAKALAEQGNEVVGLDNFNSYYDPQLKEDRINHLLSGLKVKIYRRDLSDLKSLRKIFEENVFDQIYHLGAQAGVRYSLENPQVYIDSNILGTHNLLELSREFRVKDFIFASSSSVYGNNQKIPFAESDLVDQPISLYAATKKANELEAYVYHHLFGLNVTGLRFFTVYGPWGRPDMAYFKFTKAILAGQPIDVYSQGQLKRDFTYIDDIVAGVIAAGKKCQGYEIFNLGHNQPVIINDFVKIIEQHLGVKAKINYLSAQPGDVEATYADITKAKDILGWQPVIGINEGLKKFIDWYKNYYGQPNQEI
ncbi:MAG: NAD-dependent epimerase/dehydratase family protein [Candidatus Buchananbacteria bacterium]